jgi:hypothetical protein
MLCTYRPSIARSESTAPGHWTTLFLFASAETGRVTREEILVAIGCEWSLDGSYLFAEMVDEEKI